jgi:RNA polymerase sigma-70 factor (ECF subfamily)
MSTGSLRRELFGLDDGTDTAPAEAFDIDRLVRLHGRELHVHCYRMLGSPEDAEDAVQETFIRAWARQDTFASRGTVRAWLYGIATNACLDALRQRKSRAWPTHGWPAAQPRQHPAPPADIAWLRPYPDRLLTLDLEGNPGPEAAYAARETIELAFLAALQHLPPRQRAVLILRDVMRWPAGDVATVLETTTTAVNSALQRAHATMATKLDADPHTWQAARERDHRHLLQALVAAWEREDVPKLLELLRDDARLVMPPRPTWFDGRDAVAAFFTGHVFGAMGAAWRLLPTEANGQAAFGLYQAIGESRVHRRFGVGVLDATATRITQIAMFVDEPHLFDLFGLPGSA